MYTSTYATSLTSPCLAVNPLEANHHATSSCGRLLSAERQRHDPCSRHATRALRGQMRRRLFVSPGRPVSPASLASLSAGPLSYEKSGTTRFRPDGFPNQQGAEEYLQPMPSFVFRISERGRRCPQRPTAEFRHLLCGPADEQLYRRRRTRRKTPNTRRA